MPGSVDIKKNYFTTGVCMIPHPDKAYKGGEDAFSGSQDACMFCLADGVGGWASKGIDPGLYSRELCHQFKQLYED
jgi:protein phosphatase PTC7